MNSFPSVLESIKDLKFHQVEGLLKLSQKFKRREGFSFFPAGRPVIATSFLENSTRTKHSFAIAIQRLGAMYIDFNAETSSLKKGETLEETLLTLHSQGVDLCVIRTDVSRELAKFKDYPPIKIINGGDGIHQHPTQALLDLLTMTELAPDLKGKTLAIIGDIVHSRVGHSLYDLLPMLGVNLIFCGPTKCLPPQSDFPSAYMTEDLEEAVKKSDFLYSLRIQKERHTGVKLDYYKDYHNTHGLSLKKLKDWNHLVPVFHPGPVNVGVELSLDIMRSEYYQGYEQVKNSIFMRMAIIQAVMQNGDKGVGIKNDWKI